MTLNNTFHTYIDTTHAYRRNASRGILEGLPRNINDETRNCVRSSIYFFLTKKALSLQYRIEMRDFDRRSLSGECHRYYETPFYAIAYVLRSITFFTSQSISDVTAVNPLLAFYILLLI
jgi:hypothetical protein